MSLTVQQREDKWMSTQKSGSKPAETTKKGTKCKVKQY